MLAKTKRNPKQASSAGDAPAPPRGGRPEIRHPDILTPAEAAEYLRVKNERTLYETLAREFPLAKGTLVAGERRYHREDLDALAAQLFGKVPRPARVTTSRISF